MTGQKKSPLIIIFLTIFIYLVGFGIVIPIIPALGRDFGASALQVGLLMSVYSIMQFLFAPIWGQISDRVGRRPVLLLCLVGEGAAYLLFAWARSLEMLFLARMAAGFFGASLSTANAYISDVTPAHERSKGMALIGAAFGLGFILGPAIGGGLSLWGKTISDQPFFATTFTAIGVALICFANFIFAYFKLDESLKQKKTEKRKARLHLIKNYAYKPLVGPLLLVFSLASISMSAMEATLVLLVGERFQWGIVEVSFGFALIGLCSAFNQGYLVRKVLPLWGERKVLSIGLASMACSLIGIAFAPTVVLIAVAVVLLTLGYSFTNPSTVGSISLLTSSDEQGEVLGATQSLASLGRVIGPALGGYLFGHFGSASPYLLGSVLSFAAFALVMKKYALLPESAKQGASHATS